MLHIISDRPKQLIFSPQDYRGLSFTTNLSVEKKSTGDPALLVKTHIPQSGLYSPSETLHTRNGIDKSQFYTLESLNPHVPEIFNWVLNGKFPLFHDLLHAITGIGTGHEAKALLATFAIGKEGVAQGLIDPEKYQEAFQRIKQRLETYDLGNLLEPFNEQRVNSNSIPTNYSKGLIALIEDYSAEAYAPPDAPTDPEEKEEEKKLRFQELNKILNQKFMSLDGIPSILDTYFQILERLHNLPYPFSTSITVLPNGIIFYDESNFTRFQSGDDLIKYLLRPLESHSGLTCLQIN
jgi:hypothetical protein